QRFSQQIIVSFRSASGIRVSDAPFKAAAVHYVQLVERQFITDHTQAISRQLPSRIQIFENLRHSSQLPDDVQEVVNGHVGQRHAQIFQRQLVGDLLEINGMPCFHERNSVDYAGKSAEF